MKLHLISASILLAAVPMFAQGAPTGPPQGHGPRMAHGFGPGTFGAMRQPVTNAPYSATFTNTSTEKLQDGTVLTHTTTRVVSRDSLGRTREEITMPGRGADAKPHMMIVIVDPVTKTITNLNAEKKIAMVHAMPEPRDDRGPGGWGGDHGRRGPGGPPPVGDTAQAAPPAPGAEGDTHGPRGDHHVDTTDLGSKTIAGVVATGKRMTRTVPVNAMGNSAPIISTHEEWFSPDLKIELSRSDVNPFRGTDTLAVSGLTKAEPAAALFKVPEGYTVEAAPQRAFGRRGFGGPRRGDAAPPPPPSGM